MTSDHEFYPHLKDKKGVKDTQINEVLASNGISSIPQHTSPRPSCFVISWEAVFTLDYQYIIKDYWHGLSFSVKDKVSPKFGISTLTRVALSHGSCQ